jgi:hypothetical protein
MFIARSVSYKSISYTWSGVHAEVRDRNRIEQANNLIQFDSSQPIQIDFELIFFVPETNRTDLKILLSN